MAINLRYLGATIKYAALCELQLTAMLAVISVTQGEKITKIAQPCPADITSTAPDLPLYETGNFAGLLLIPT